MLSQIPTSSHPMWTPDRQRKSTHAGRFQLISSWASSTTVISTIAFPLSQWAGQDALFFQLDGSHFFLPIFSSEAKTPIPCRKIRFTEYAVLYGHKLHSYEHHA